MSGWSNGTAIQKLKLCWRNDDYQLDESWRVADVSRYRSAIVVRRYFYPAVCCSGYWDAGDGPMRNFTPGPWLADDNEGFGAWNIWNGHAPSGASTGRVLANVFGDSAEAEANAQLISAAPDLFNAGGAFAFNLGAELTDATQIGQILGTPIYAGEIRRLNAAMRKAEGRCE